MNRKRLRIREARRLGLTVRNIGPIVRKIRDEPDFADKTHAEIAVEVAERLAEQNPDGFRDPNLDWDAIIEFIEKLLPLILKLIEIFSLFI